MKARRTLTGAGNHAIGVGVGCQADQKALVRTRCGLDIVRPQIALQSSINHIGGKNQSHLPQRRQFWWRSFRRGIDHHDFVRRIEKLPRNGFTHWLASQLFYRLALVVDVLQIHRANNVDSVGQQLLHILPAMWVAAPWIVVGQAIDHANLGMTAQNCRNIYDRHALDVNGRDNFERTQDWLDFSRNLRLERPHDYVLPAFFPPPRFIKHAERLADARGITEKYL